MTSQWRHRNKTHSSYSEWNLLQNIYFGIFTVWKLTEWRRFVTYLWNDPRITVSLQSQDETGRLIVSLKSTDTDVHGTFCLSSVISVGWPLQLSQLYDVHDLLAFWQPLHQFLVQYQSSRMYGDGRWPVLPLKLKNLTLHFQLLIARAQD